MRSFQLLTLAIVWFAFAFVQVGAQQTPARSITIQQEDGTRKVVEFNLPKVEVKVTPRDGSPVEHYWDWAQKDESFFLTLADEIRGVFEKLGADATLELLKNYADFGLKNINLQDGLQAAQAKVGAPLGTILSVVLKAHQNSREAIEFVNLNLKRMAIPIQYIHEIDNQKPDPFEPRPNERGVVSVMEKARYIAGPGVIALGVATGQTSLDTPLVATSGLQTAYEVQFANSWINRHIWTPIFGFTGRARQYLLGVNPGVLAINFAYPVSLYEFQHYLIQKFGTDPAALKERPEAYTLFALGAILFTLSYGKMQDDLIVLRNTGRISEGQRYVRESIANITANALRVATIFVPVVLWKFQAGAATYNVDLGTAGLLALGVLATTPHAVKTLVGPRARAAYVRHTMSAVNASGLKGACLSLVDRLSNPFGFRTQ